MSTIESFGDKYGPIERTFSVSAWLMNNIGGLAAVSDLGIVSNNFALQATKAE